MKKIYYLKSCSSCRRFLKELETPASVILQDIKEEPVTEEQLEAMRSLSGSYEFLFSRRAKKYSERNLKNKSLSENDYRRLILEEYTFLKRPVVVIDDQIFIGTSKKTLTAVGELLSNS